MGQIEATVEEPLRFFLETLVIFQVCGEVDIEL